MEEFFILVMVYICGILVMVYICGDGFILKRVKCCGFVINLLLYIFNIYKLFFWFRFLRILFS